MDGEPSLNQPNNDSRQKQVNMVVFIAAASQLALLSHCAMVNSRLLMYTKVRDTRVASAIFKRSGVWMKRTDT